MKSAKDCFNKRLEPACTKGLTDANIATMEDSLRGVVASLTTINNALLNLDDGVPTSRAELMTTFLGDSRDAYLCLLDVLDLWELSYKR